MNLDAGSIGIIGGADGPTAIFVTGSWNGAQAAILLLAAAAAVFLLVRRRKKK